MRPWSLPPHLLDNQQQDILLTFVFYTQGASNQLHVFNILQSTSQKATFQDFGHWRLTGTSFHTRNLLRRIIEDSSQPMTYHLLRTSTAQIATYKELYSTYWDRGLSKFQTPVCPIWWPFQSYLSVPWTLSNWWTNHPTTCCWPY